MRKRTKNSYTLGMKQVIINHIHSNISLYLRILIIFILGICIGIVVINNLSEIELQSINGYIGKSVNDLKTDTEIQRGQMLKSTFFKNIIIVLVIWIFGLTLAGNLVLYFITLILGITFGYTMASIMTCFTFIQGILFFVTAMLLQNIINIPAILFLIVQGIQSHHNILSKQNNPKYILAKHSICSIIILFILTIASLVEVYISGNFVHSIIKYL